MGKEQKTKVDFKRLFSSEPGTYMSLNTWTAENAYKILENHSKSIWLSLHQYKVDNKGFIISPTYYEKHWGVPKSSYYRAVKELQIAGFFEYVDNKHFIFHSGFREKDKKRQIKYATDNFIRIYKLASSTDKRRIKNFYKKVVKFFVEEENPDLNKKEVVTEVDKRVKRVLEQIKECSTSSDTSISESSSPAASNVSSIEGTEKSNVVKKSVSSKLVDLINKQWR